MNVDEIRPGMVAIGRTVFEGTRVEEFKVNILGVRNQWRRQGLGRSLLLHCFHEFRRRGFHAAALGVDADSLTGANRLYESAGMRVVRRSDVYEKAL